ncbi:hypothetical protein Tco_1339849 [Tanacetum coccineum]
MCEMMTHWSEKPLRHWNGRDEGQWRLEGNVKATEALKGKNERLKRAKLWLTLENNQLTRRQNTTHQTSCIEILWEHRCNGRRHANSEQPSMPPEVQ